jgi:hypothetical protein
MEYALSNDIYIGSVIDPLYHFENVQIVMNSAKGVFALDVIGNELSVDQFSVVIRWTEDDMFDGFITSDDKVFQTSTNDDLLVLQYAGASTELKDFLKELPFGTPVWWYVNSSFYAKGYLKSVDRQSKNSFKLTCVSGVGLLDTSMHPGNLYQNAAIQDVLASIIGGAFSYTVSDAVKNTARVYGRLPYDTRRNNLHRLLFASGAALMRGMANNDYVIDYLSTTITDVPASRVALLGSVQYQLPSNRAEITEHAFFQTANDPVETLFDNTSETAADHLTVIFDGAAYDLATTGNMTINESGVNYAIVSGLGTLTGKYYVHTTQIDVLENRPNNEPVRVRRVTENELITALNARNVSRRVLSYYQSAKTVKAKILTQGEKCGNLLRFNDSFGDLTTAYLSKADTLVTTVIGAQCQLIEGFQPGNNGNNFLHRQAITANGNFTIPAGVTFIRVALIGGAQGGQGGYDGEEGAYKRKGTDPIWDPGEPGGELTSEYKTIVEDYLWMYYMGYANGDQRIPAGGNPGASGQQAKVYVVEHAVTPGEVISFIVGSGGAGGTRNGGIGALGTPTTASSTSLGFVSSENGLASQGYFDPMTGDAFATPGIAGLKGGNGGRTDTISLVGNQGGNGLSGGSSGSYNGGAGGTGIIRNLSDYGHTELSKVSGGGGGGGAYGVAGSPGGNATFEPAHTDPNTGTRYGDRLTSGAGGNGANALPPPKPTYGVGGGGGNGGGAGGNCGGVAGLDGYYVSDVATTYKHQGGAAGLGSIGGAGGDGIAVIYW